MSTDDEKLKELAAYDEDDEFDTVAPEQSSASKSSRGDDLHTVHSSGFRDLLLKPELQRAIQEAAFEAPSEVQTECLPQALLGTDVLCQAKSGMGKTLVFVLSILQQMEVQQDEEAHVTALVITHAREMAYQIYNDFERFTTYLPAIRTMVLYGGVSVQKQREQLRQQTPHIVIGTPGRVMQLATERDSRDPKKKTLDLSRVKFFVIDECDSVIESMNMRSDVQKILRCTPHEKQVMMFTATLSPETRMTCKKFMSNPHEIIINDGSKLTLYGLLQYYVDLEEAAKTRTLIGLLDELDFNQCVIFVSSPQRAEQLAKILQEQNFPCKFTHGGIEQEKRIAVYKSMKESGTRILVATKLFGRGIDFERINVVFNYDMPASSNEYLHKVGRAGRFGTKGLAISFVAGDKDREVLDSVQSVFAVKVPPMPATIESTAYRQS